MSQPRTAFVLAGGGSLDALQVGTLAEILEAGERGPEPSRIPGASQHSHPLKARPCRRNGPLTCAP